MITRFLILIPLLLSSCTSRKLDPSLSYPIQANLFSLNDRPSFTVDSQILVDDTDLGLPADLIANDSVLVVIDVSSGSPFRYYERGSGRLIETVGTIGKGPDEFTRPWSMDFIDEKRFSVFDAGNHRLSILLFNSHGLSAVEKQFDLPLDGLALNAIIISDSSFLVNGIFNGNRLVETQLNGDVLKSYAVFPMALFDPRLALDYRGEAHSKADVSRIAVALNNVDVVEIYSRKGEILSVTAGPYLLGPRDGRRGFVDLAVTDKFVYGLLAAQDLSDEAENTNLGRRIIVFDWDGSFLGSVLVPNLSFGLTIDGNTGRGFLSVHVPRPVIESFQLPEGLF